MPSADFCTAVRDPYGSLSPYRTRCRSPGVSLTAFTAHLPNLQPGLIVDTGLRGSGPARPTQTASYSVPVRQVAALLPRFLQTAPRGHRPCASLALCLHQTWAEDLHLRAVKHARHTQRHGKRLCAVGTRARWGLAFPTPLWTARAPPTGSTGLHPSSCTCTTTSRIARTRAYRDGRRLTDTRRFAPTSVHLRRNPRSPSAESVFNFSGIRIAQASDSPSGPVTSGPPQEPRRHRPSSMTPTAMIAMTIAMPPRVSRNSAISHSF